MGVRFGTDGIRGLANVEVTPELALAIGRAAARHLPSETFLVGSDTRRSSPMLAAALAAGLAAEGGRVIDLGVVPTPALAYLAQQWHHPGAMVSASHNPYFDNGIKLISSAGSKLPDALERGIEAEIDQLLTGVLGSVPSGSGVGEIVLDASGLDLYEEHLAATVRLGGSSPLKVVCDCANGSASEVAPRVLERFGLDLTMIGAAPNGTNINDGVGSTATGALAAEVRRNGADLGIAFDGDADRCLAIDERGEAVDGDALIALFALDLARRGALRGDGVVVTVMSNLGLHKALEAAGIEVVSCAVGDRHILESLDERRLVLGGEQSGHIVFREDASTGDGLLTALKLLELCAASDRPLSELVAGAMTRFPQELRTVKVTEPARYATNVAITEAIAEVERSLAGSGRVLVRASGTESAVRVMVEADRAEVAMVIVEQLAALVEQELSTPVR